MSERETEPARDAVRRVMRLAYEVAGKHEALGRMIAAGTGRDYSGATRASISWVNGEAVPPGDVLWVALRIARPDVVAALDSEASQIRARQAELQQQVDRAMAMILELGDRLGVDFIDRFSKAAKAGDAEAQEFANLLLSLRDGTGG